MSFWRRTGWRRLLLPCLWAVTVIVLAACQRLVVHADPQLGLQFNLPPDWELERDEHAILIRPPANRRDERDYLISIASVPDTEPDALTLLETFFREPYGRSDPDQSIIMAAPAWVRGGHEQMATGVINVQLNAAQPFGADGALSISADDFGIEYWRTSKMTIVKEGNRAVYVISSWRANGVLAAEDAVAEGIIDSLVFIEIEE